MAGWCCPTLVSCRRHGLQLTDCLHLCRPHTQSPTARSWLLRLHYISLSLFTIGSSLPMIFGSSRHGLKRPVLETTRRSWTKLLEVYFSKSSPTASLWELGEYYYYWYEKSSIEKGWNSTGGEYMWFSNGFGKHWNPLQSYVLDLLYWVFPTKNLHIVLLDLFNF